MFSLCFISQYFSFNVFEFNLLVILVCEDICIWYFVDVCFCVFPPIFCLQCLSISYLILGMCWNMYLIFYWPLPEDPYFSFNIFQSLGHFGSVEMCIWYFIDVCLRDTTLCYCSICWYKLSHQSDRYYRKLRILKI